MNMRICFLSCLLSLFSTAVMSYIAMATPIGPWIAPTLVLCALLFFSVVGSGNNRNEAILLSTISGSVGGILATAYGFTFPTLYFLNAELFNSWLQRPLYFVLMLTASALAAGWYGMWIANLTEDTFIVEKQLPFPIGQLIYKMVSVQKQMAKAIELAIGFFSTMIFCALQDLKQLGRLIPKAVTLCPAFSYHCFNIPLIRFDLWPMLWAIGFVTGHIIAIPLIVGSVTRLLFVQPVNTLFFAGMSSMDFILAFCSGMVVSGAISGFVRLSKQLMQKKERAEKNGERGNGMFDAFAHLDRAIILEGVAMLLFVVSVLSYAGFGPLAQLYLLAFTFVCTYQIIMIAGKIGLAQLGRFATFVLVPALFIFNLNLVQITLISTFVEVCAGVAVDILFGRKVVQLSGIDKKKAKRYQYLGLLVSALSIGVIFWLLIKQFGLGSPELFAQRSQARALLIHVKQFNYWVVLIGAVYGYALKLLKMSPMLVLGGLLMPLNISLGLVVGGLSTLLVEDKEQWYPFWSGVFAANSIWMLLQALI